MSVTELFELDGSFTIDAAFSEILSFTSSAQYVTLSDAVVTGVSVEHDGVGADSASVSRLFKLLLFCSSFCVSCTCTCTYVHSF